MMPPTPSYIKVFVENVDTVSLNSSKVDIVFLEIFEVGLFSVVSVGNLVHLN